MSVVWKPSWERAFTIATDYKLQHIKELYFNPIHFLSLMADQALVGSEDRPQAWVAKLANVGYHVINSVLVFVLLLAMGTSRIPAFFGALLFAVHPVQVGTVAWIAERKNLLATFFCLSSLILFMKYLYSGYLKFLLFVLMLFLAGLLSKPSAVVLPPVLIATAFAVGANRSVRTRGLLVACFMLLVAAVWGLGVMKTERTFFWIVPPWQYRPLLASGVILFYLEKFVLPVPLSPMYPKWNVVANVGWFALFACCLAAASGIVIYFRKRIDRWILWGLFFFLTSLAPISGLIPFGYMSHSYVGDHFLYLPMVGLAVVVARSIQLLQEKIGADSRYGKLPVLAMCAWIGLLIYASVHQEQIWRNGMTLWAAALKHDPTSPAAYNNYGYLCVKKGELDRAEALFKKAIEFGPGMDKPYFNLGLIYQERGELESAKKMFAKAATLDLDGKEPLVMVSKVLQAQGKPEEAVTFLEGNVRRFPSAAELHTGLGLAHIQTGAEDKAVEAFSRAIELKPFVAEPYVHKAALMLSSNNPDEAIRLAGEALKLENRADAHNVLGAAYGFKGDHAGALKHFLAAFKLSPDFPSLRDNIANALMDRGDYQAAAEFCLKSEAEGKSCASDTQKRIRDRE